MTPDQLAHSILKTSSDVEALVEAEVVAENSRSATPTAISLRELEESVRKAGETDPNELIKRRFLCKGGAGR